MPARHTRLRTTVAALLLPLLFAPGNLAATPSSGFYNATAAGGSFLTTARGTFPPGLGEPLNIVISSLSSPYVLSDDGFFDFMVSVNMAGECLGQHQGSDQASNLGDGRGLLNQSGILRYDYGDPILGTCKETVIGGNHLRWWVQNGSTANSGAIFIAASVELNLTYGHDIAPNGYDAGRDELTGNATSPGGSTSPMTGRMYTTTSVMTPGYLAVNSSLGINHGIQTDGNIAVWNVQIRPPASNSSSPATPSTKSSAISTSMSWISASVGIGSLVVGLALLA